MTVARACLCAGGAEARARRVARAAARDDFGRAGQPPRRRAVAGDDARVAQRRAPAGAGVCDARRLLDVVVVIVAVFAAAAAVVVVVVAVVVAVDAIVVVVVVVAADDVVAVGRLFRSAGVTCVSRSGATVSMLGSVTALSTRIQVRRNRRLCSCCGGRRSCSCSRRYRRRRRRRRDGLRRGAAVVGGGERARRAERAHGRAGGAHRQSTRPRPGECCVVALPRCAAHGATAWRAAAVQGGAAYLAASRDPHG